MSNLEEHKAEQARITAECEAGECDHPECREEAKPQQTFNMLIAATTRVYANIEVEAVSLAEAVEKVRADVEAAEPEFWSQTAPDDDNDLYQFDILEVSTDENRDLLEEEIQLHRPETNWDVISAETLSRKVERLLRSKAEAG